MIVHVLDDWFDTLRGLPCFALLDGYEVKVWNDHEEDVDALARRLAEAEALVLFRERTKIGRPLLESLPRLRLISQRGACPHVDVDACTDCGVLLCSNMSSGEPSYATAELAWALALAAMRQLPAQMASVKAGSWQAGVGRSMRGRRLGLYGYGRIGKAVAGYGEAFGMDVVWWASEEGRARARAEGAAVAESRGEFFAESDVISLHLRLTPATRGIIAAEDLALMRADSVLVNTSRAGLIAPGALLEALEAGHPGSAAIDVFDTEPLTNPADPLLAHPRLVATPHIGFVTEDDLEVQFRDAFEQINAYARGAPVCMVNPEAWNAG